MAFDFQSVGGAAGDAVQKYISDQRELKRRALLDELNQRDTESSIAARDEGARSLAAQRESEIAKEKLGIFMGAHRAGDQLDLDKLDPITRTLLEKNQMINTATPQVSTGEAVQDAEGNWVPGGDQHISTEPARSVYTGTGDEQRGIESQAALRMVADDPNLNPEAKQWLKIVLAGRDPEKGLTNPPAGIFDPLQPDLMFDEAKGTTTPIMVGGKPSMSKNGRMVTRNRPPQGPQPQYVGTLDGVPLIMRNGKIEPSPIVGSPDSRIEPKPSSSSDGAGKNTPTGPEVNSLRAAMNQTRDNPGKQSAQGLWSQQNQIINKYVSQPELRNVAVGILSDPEASKFSIPELLEGSGIDQLSPEAQQQFTDILRIILGRENAR